VKAAGGEGRWEEGVQLDRSLTGAWGRGCKGLKAGSTRARCSSHQHVLSTEAMRLPCPSPYPPPWPVQPSSNELCQAGSHQCPG